MASRTSNRPFSSICQARVSDGTDSLRRQLGGALGLAGAAVEEALRRGRDFHAGEEMGGLQQVLHHRQRIGAGIIERAEIGQRLGQHRRPSAFSNRSSTRPRSARPSMARIDLGGDRAAFAMGDGLVEQRQRIARRAFGGAGDQRQRAFLDLHLFLFGDGRQIGGQLGRCRCGAGRSAGSATAPSPALCGFRWWRR